MNFSIMVHRWWFRSLLFIASLAISAVLVMALVPLNGDGMAATAVLYLAICAASIGIERLRGGGITSFGLPLHALAWRHLAVGATVATASILVVIVLALLLGASFTVVPLAASLSVLYFLAITIVLAWGEELLFRGILFNAIEERFGSVTAILITSVPFGLAHVANPGSSMISVANTILAGVLLGAFVSRFRSLWPGVGFHIVWNVLLGAAIGPISGMAEVPFAVAKLNTSELGTLQWIVDGPYGIEQGLAVTVLLIGCIVWVYRQQFFDPFVAAARFRIQLHARALRYKASLGSTSFPPQISQ